MVDYAVRRTREHLLRFMKLYEQLKTNAVDEPWLSTVESRDNLFSAIDYRVYHPA
jgi:1,4-alpha-glucan branching enzyme